LEQAKEKVEQAVEGAEKVFEKAKDYVAEELPYIKDKAGNLIQEAQDKLTSTTHDESRSPHYYGDKGELYT